MATRKTLNRGSKRRRTKRGKTNLTIERNVWKVFARCPKNLTKRTRCDLGGAPSPFELSMYCHSSELLIIFMQIYTSCYELSPVSMSTSCSPNQVHLWFLRGGVSSSTSKERTTTYNKTAPALESMRAMRSEKMIAHGS